MLVSVNKHNLNQTIELHNKNTNFEYIKYLFADKVTINKFTMSRLIRFWYDNMMSANIFGCKLMLNIMHENVCVGTLSMISRYSEYELAMLIDENYSGQGFGTGALIEFIQYLDINKDKFEQKPVYWKCHKSNIKSLKLALRAGLIRLNDSVYDNGLPCCVLKVESEWFRI